MSDLRWAMLVFGAILISWSTASFAQEFTAEQVTAPNAFAGPGPSNLTWSPSGSVLLYVKPSATGGALVLHDALTGHERQLFDPAERPENIDISSAQWSPTGTHVLVSGKTSLYVIHAKTGKLFAIAKDNASESGATFSPDGSKVAFTRLNNLVVADLASGKENKLTQDGGPLIYNGVLDWVYEEELATRAAQPAFAWSPDSSSILYMRLDDRSIQAHPTIGYGTIPPNVQWQRYPTAGSANPRVALFVVDLKGNEQVVTLSRDAEYVLPFLSWTPDGQGAVFMTANRKRTHLALQIWNVKAGRGRNVQTETNSYWVNDLFYSKPLWDKDGKRFFWLSERTGFFHLFRIDREGKAPYDLTPGYWMIDPSAWNLLDPSKPFQLDLEGRWAYFSCTRNGAMERQVYRVKLDGTQLEQITKENGTHYALLSANGKFLVDQYSNIGTPPITSILRSDGTPMRVLAATSGPSLDFPKVVRKFHAVTAPDGTELMAQLVTPPDFDENKRYPVVVHWYGGPGLQLVTNSYGAGSLFQVMQRDVLYTQMGYLVWRLDNRGSFGRGHEFETATFGKLGPIALADQLVGVDYLKSLPYVDATRIGCDGHSFGGFLTLYALIHAPSVFKCGVSGSPVTSWRFYDTIYTERYMRTPAENPKGYAETDLIVSTDSMAVEPLILHGLEDTNVHLQNSVQFMNALMNRGKLYEFVALPGQNHDYTGAGLTQSLEASASYLKKRL